MADADDLHAPSAVINGVENTVIADTNSIGLLAVQLLGADGAGMLFEREEFPFEPAKRWFAHSV